MTAILEQLGVVLALVAVMAYPGAPILAIMGARAAVPAALLPAAALAVTLTSCVAALVLTLWLELSIDAVLAWQLAITLAATMIGLSRRRRSGEHVSVVRWLLRHSPVGWLVAIPWTYGILAAVAAAIAFLFGGWLDDGDMMYHVAVARKLGELTAPGFASIQLFADGSLHPGYPAPAWHELWAVTARLTGSDVLTVLWMAAVPAAAWGTLAAAGLAQVALRSTTAGALGGLVFLLADGLSRPPLYGGLLGSASPTGLTVDVLLPTALALWLACLWHADPRARRSAGALLCLAVVPAILAVHVSYVAFLGLMVAGYALVWALRSPWVRRIVLRHAKAGAALALVAGLGLALMVPVLSQLSTLDASTDAAAANQEFADFEEILVGTAESYHLRADLLAQFGGLSLAGACCLVLAFARRREPAAWLLLGSGALVLAISQVDALFMGFSSVASVSQSKRLQYAVPYELALVLGLLLVSCWASRLWRSRHLPRRMAAAALVAASAAALFMLAWRVDPLPRLKATPDVPPEVLQVVLVLLGLGCAWMVRELLVRVRSRLRAAPPDPHAPVVALDRLARVLLTVCVVAAAIPVVWPFLGNARDEVRERPTSALRAYDLDELDPVVVRELRTLPVGTVVMAPPDISLRVAAVAPVYVSSAPARHVAGTEENRRSERLAEARVLYGLDATPDERVQVVERSKAKLLVLERPRREGEARAGIRDAFCGTGWNVVASGETHLVLRRTGNRPGSDSNPDAGSNPANSAADPVGRARAAGGSTC